MEVISATLKQDFMRQHRVLSGWMAASPSPEEVYKNGGCGGGC